MCSTCDRSLQDPYLYCSISCKVLLNYSKNTAQIFIPISQCLWILSHTLFNSGPCLNWVSLIFQIDHLTRTEGGLSEYLRQCKFMALPDPGLDDGVLTPDSVLEPAGSVRTSSGSGGYAELGCLSLACTATTEVVRKKRSSLSAFRAACRPVFSPVSEISVGRRKGTPHRAPLYWICADKFMNENRKRDLVGMILK